MRNRVGLWTPGIRLLLFVLFTLGLAAQHPTKYATDSVEQQQAIAGAMKQHSYSISFQDGVLQGPGMDFLAQNTANAQFVLFGEEHNVKEWPEFLDALFSFLHQHANFNYFALESDPVSAHLVSIPPLRGNETAWEEYAARYPNAVTFATDQELRMILDATRISTGGVDSVWGLDQSFGVLHALDRLSALPGFHSTPKFVELHKEAEQRDSKRFGKNVSHYMSEVVRLADLEELRKEQAPPEGSEAQFILDNLVSSSQIYGYYLQGEAGEPTYYFNGYVREEQMKHLFLREYRAAEAHGEHNPRVMLKLGQWHVRRGSGPSNLQTLGNFVTEFATANGTQALTLGVYLRGPWRDVSTQDGMKPIALATDATKWSVIDFRPVRAIVAGSRLGAIHPNLLSQIYGFDAGLVIGDAKPATYTILEKGAQKP